MDIAKKLKLKSLVFGKIALGKEKLLYENAYTKVAVNNFHIETTKPQGVKPDIEIPWTPDHFERDVDLDKCLELIRQSSERQD